MKRLNSHTLGIEQGELVLFSDFQADGDMWTGKGDRIVRRRVEFSEAFRKAPSAMVNLSMWDTDHATNTRIDLRADDITERGFDVVFQTWGDTRVARIRVGWTAMSMPHEDDDWELY